MHRKEVDGGYFSSGMSGGLDALQWLVHTAAPAAPSSTIFLTISVASLSFSCFDPWGFSSAGASVLAGPAGFFAAGAVASAFGLAFAA